MSKRLTRKIQTLTRPLNPYRAFDQIDGRHPWQNAVKEGFVPYYVRRLEKGKVAYFNFNLAREMGLLPPDHGDELTPELEKKLIETFSIQIINEYDLQNGVRIPKHLINEHPYMATRYLQLQHANKRGRTSGDGRSIWNGFVRHKGVTWDVSSRGTGVTCLAPGSVEANRPLRTGDGKYGYGCGLADMSELLGSAVLSEIFHLQGIQTERVLVIIDIGRGCGIGVRAAPNLLRPAHLFLYLKQGRIDPLRRATDYFIQRQISNGSWKFDFNSPDRYRRMLKEITRSFARFAAQLEREYIFAWLDWDGDNVLASAGIIDYGSIRQFGLRHDQYRYEDVDRYSTNLNEQRGKARLTVQVFAQLVNYLETGRRERLTAFANHPSLREFDREFDRRVREIFLEQCGLSRLQAERLMTEKRSLVEKFYSAFLALEKTKTKTRLQKLPDGINRPAIFNMRKALRELAACFAREPELMSAGCLISCEEFFELILSSQAKRPDKKLTRHLRQRLERFLKLYVQVMSSVCGTGPRASIDMKEIALRAEKRNRAGRITGNGAEFVVQEILKAQKRGMSFDEIHSAIDLFITSQVAEPMASGRRFRPKSLASNAGRLFQEFMSIAQEFEEDI